MIIQTTNQLSPPTHLENVPDLPMAKSPFVLYLDQREPEWKTTSL